MASKRLVRLCACGLRDFQNPSPGAGCSSHPSTDHQDYHYSHDDDHDRDHDQDCYCSKNKSHVS